MRVIHRWQLLFGESFAIMRACFGSTRPLDDIKIINGYGDYCGVYVHPNEIVFNYKTVLLWAWDIFNRCTRRCGNHIGARCIFAFYSAGKSMDRAGEKRANVQKPDPKKLIKNRHVTGITQLAWWNCGIRFFLISG